MHIAARIMCNHRIHHLVVTHENEIVGLVSSFDLLRLIENKRFVKNLPSRPRKGGGQRRKQEERFDAPDA